MLDNLQALIASVHPLLVPTAGLLALLATAWVLGKVSRMVLLSLFERAAKATPAVWDDLLLERKVVKRAVQILPAIITYLGASGVPELHESAVDVVRNLSIAYMALMAMLSLNGLLSVANDLYERRPDSHKRPIKGYVQITKIVLFFFGGILAISAMLGKSPLIFLSGLGALTAVLLLIFKDTLLSLVASVQLSSLDMLRKGDWIEMPQYNADGDVVDIALHTVRVQNWDKTVTSIPTNALIADSFKNWRGMTESGGRRIKRSLLIDMQSVRFLSADEITHFQRFALLRDYLAQKQQELAVYNSAVASKTEQFAREGEQVPDAEAVNLRRLTNLGTLRAYLFNYLKNHPRLHNHMTLLVRQLAPNANGIPIELYCFTNTTDWVAYEAIQSDLFDHLLAILPEFGLRVFQEPSGNDLQQIWGEQKQGPQPD